MMGVTSYLLISAFCAALNIAVLIIAESAGLSLPACALLSFCACVVVGYGLHARFIPTALGSDSRRISLKLEF